MRYSPDNPCCCGQTELGNSKSELWLSRRFGIGRLCQMEASFGKSAPHWCREVRERQCLWSSPLTEAGPLMGCSWLGTKLFRPRARWRNCSAMLHQVRDRNHCPRELAFGLRVALPASVLFSRNSCDINCDSIRVALTERPVPGNSGEHAAIVDQSGLRMPVIWKGRSGSISKARCAGLSVSMLCMLASDRMA